MSDFNAISNVEHRMGDKSPKAKDKNKKQNVAEKDRKKAEASSKAASQALPGKIGK